MTVYAITDTKKGELGPEQLLVTPHTAGCYFPSTVDLKTYALRYFPSLLRSHHLRPQRQPHLGLSSVHCTILVVPWIEHAGLIM